MAQRKPYNPNTSYGRKKMREQAYQNIQNYTPEQKAEYDKISNGCWIIFIIIAIIAAIVIYNVS